MAEGRQDFVRGASWKDWGGVNSLKASLQAVQWKTRKFEFEQHPAFIEVKRMDYCAVPF